MLKSPVVCLILAAAASAALPGSTAHGAGPENAPKLQGTWVLRAIAHEHDRNKVQVFEDDSFLQLVFDGNVLQVRLKGKKPVTYHYRLTLVPEEPGIYALEFRRGDQGPWQTVHCHRGTFLVVLASDMDNFFPAPIVERLGRHYFMFEHLPELDQAAGQQQAKAAQSLQGTWRLTAVLSDSSPVPNAKWSERDLTLAFSPDKATLHAPGRNFNTSRYAVEAATADDFIICFHDELRVDMKVSEEGNCLQVSRKALLKAFSNDIVLDPEIQLVFHRVDKSDTP